MFLPHFDVFCNLLLNRRTATWNLLSETWHLIAAIQLTVSCSELYFVRCCALKWTGKYASESKAMFLKEWCFDVSFLTSISVSTVILRLGKVYFLNSKLISETFCLLSLLNSRYNNGFRLTETNFVFHLLSLDYILRLLDHFSGSLFTRNGFIFFLPAFRTCSMPRQDFFVPFLLPSHVKYCLNSQNFPPF